RVKFVQVRSVEEGFQGSWHSATVIACQGQALQIQYDHILCNDGSENLIETVPSIVDGVVPANRTSSNHRALIRPLPPPLRFEKWCLHYGKCVDVYYEEAWWEGVILDHEDGCENRQIFFPDIGDAMTFKIEMLRITQDWDEYTGDWKPRGNWLLLEVLEDIQKEWPLQVSARQIWYDMRGNKGFIKLKEWTSFARNIWKDLVTQVIIDNLNLTHQFLLKLDSSEDLVEESQQALELSEPACDVIPNPQADLGNSLAVVPIENDGSVTKMQPSDLHNANVPPVEGDIDWNGLASIIEDCSLDVSPLMNSKMPCLEETLCSPPPGFSLLSFNPDEYSGISSNTNSEGFSSTSSKTPKRMLTSPTRKSCYMWLPAGDDLVAGTEYCPDTVAEYNLLSNSNTRPSTALIQRVRKHLAYLGWKIKFRREKGIQRLRYTSPDGKCYYSLRKLCQELRESSLEVVSLNSHDDKGISFAAPNCPSSSMLAEQLLLKGESIVHSTSDVPIIESDSCPQAVMDYYCSLAFKDKNHHHRLRKGARNELQFYAKKHLASDGWSVWYVRKRTKMELRYKSPSGRIYYSLLTACKACIDERGFSDFGASTCRPRQNTNANEETEAQLAGESSALIDIEFRGDLVPLNVSSEKWSRDSSGISFSRKLSKLKARGLRKLRKNRENGNLHFPSNLLEMIDQNVGSPKPKKGKKSKFLIKLRDDGNVDRPIRVLRSRKRARQPVVSSDNPRTVLSWLIDNNVVLPRAKVHYHSRNDHSPMAEGRITRHGIKCNCCQKVFSLKKFEAHAGSTNHQPSANIFLEDGRSLLECQMQLKRENCKKSFVIEPNVKKGKRHQSTNDYICSVCHDGGELILCDQCPSSFHAYCLGLKDVPDGDWFCPSCCCGICGQSRFNRDTEQFLDNSVLICAQCEHQYHVGCLRKRGLIKLERYSKGNWFCNRKCEQIFLGLCKLLGKPVPVGEDDLTWTLLKYTKCDSDHDASDNEALTETYSKLNVALCVMHEVFKPIKESHTRRDLVEDIVFSRWSELNRLNFRGFYTVILERNDELITVATVRIYGGKVAEVPLVGTRFQYRRRGMCRILMNELERKLRELGVERLVLPAVPSLLHTWTTSFGFSRMIESERFNFLDYTFLDFQGTVMCQKLIIKPRYTKLSARRGTQQKLCDGINGSYNIDLDGNSAVSEVFQADQVAENGIVDQGLADIAGGNGSNVGAAPMVVLVSQSTSLESVPCQSEISLECSVEHAVHKESVNIGKGHLMCYKRRRRLSAC
ncbi:uncharacterized protein LOC132269703, partial [Cornus florida]|uniref:uncharacterized protein LOC132269703 n=1 Tax=Cornus florida TaxID=4283 RepID=UPI002897BE70